MGSRENLQGCFSISTFVLSVMLIDSISSFSVSVPPVRSVCKSMQPGHDKYKPQTAPSPFIVRTDVTEIKGGNAVEVFDYSRSVEIEETFFLQGTGNKTFQGYYLQARDSKNNPVGMFNSNTLAKVHSCGGIRANAAHHANSEEKSRISVSWIAPKGYNGDVTFMGSFVENYVTFWTRVKAEPVKVLA